MKLPVEDAIRLLHECPFGALASHSLHCPGYPFASILPFVPDEAQNPLFLVSSLAEHTKNLLADGRVSLLLSRPEGENVQTGARMTLVGDARPIAASPAMVARFLRYQPDGERYLALGDFRFFRLEPKRLRLIAGFGRMGWLEETDWRATIVLSPEDEGALLERLAQSLPSGLRLLGVDPYGLDLEQRGQRLRRVFPAAIGDVGALEVAARQLLGENA